MTSMSSTDNFNDFSDSGVSVAVIFIPRLINSVCLTYQRPEDKGPRLIDPLGPVDNGPIMACS